MLPPSTFVMLQNMANSSLVDKCTIHKRSYSEVPDEFGHYAITVVDVPNTPCLYTPGNTVDSMGETPESQRDIVGASINVLSSCEILPVDSVTITSLHGGTVLIGPFEVTGVQQQRFVKNVGLKFVET